MGTEGRKVERSKREKGMSMARARGGGGAHAGTNIEILPLLVTFQSADR